MSERDACEWNPTENRAALTTDEDHAQAEVMVGDGVAWRLCQDCARLPRFRRYRVRRAIVRRAGS